MLLLLAEGAATGTVLGWVVYDTGRAVARRLLAMWRRRQYAKARGLAQQVMAGL